MLKRISHIKNVGAFKDCQARPVEFTKLTVVYGRNTYGKTTIGDVFSSLQHNNPEVVTKRKSIPHDDQQQLIDMAFAMVGENENVGKAHFVNGIWERPLVDSHNLRVFDDAFIHDHIFSSRKFTRDIKEKFSVFVLGEQGVRGANEIGAKKKLRREKSNRKRVLENEVFQGLDKLDEFLVLQPENSIEELKQQRGLLREQYATLKKQKREADVIRSRPEISQIDFPTNLEVPFSEANVVLQTSIESHHEVAKAKLEEHIKHHFSNPGNGAQWIQQGLRFNNGKTCHFCGQGLGEEALDLLAAYQRYFDDEFTRHEQFVVSTLARLQARIDLGVFNKLKNQTEQVNLKLQAYPELAEFEGYTELKEALDSEAAEIDRLSPQLQEMYESLKTSLNQKILEKRSRPHLAIAVIDVKDFKKLSGELIGAIGKVNAIIQLFSNMISAFKTSLADNTFVERVNQLETEDNTLARLIIRIEKDAFCRELIELNSELSQLDAEIPALEQTLVQQQSAYIDQYFASINGFFSELGSQGFELEKGYSRAGNTPVYFLKVKFHNQEIEEASIDSVFSESDRRALALAVFLSSLHGMPQNELAKTVVVFDDPVTSFDDHRASRYHRLLMNLSEKSEQVIYLSHFKQGVVQFLKTYGFSGNNPIKLIEIVKNNQTSKLENGDIEGFVRNDHEENREKLIDFIENRLNSLPCALRIFLETELSLRFGKQIRDNNITNENLSARMDALRDYNVVSQQVSLELHRWREDLNPDHHLWLGDDLENKRATARAFMRFVYHDLVPA